MITFFFTSFPIDLDSPKIKVLLLSICLSRLSFHLNWNMISSSHLLHLSFILSFFISIVIRYRVLSTRSLSSTELPNILSIQTTFTRREIWQICYFYSKQTMAQCSMNSCFQNSPFVYLLVPHIVATYSHTQHEKQKLSNAQYSSEWYWNIIIYEIQRFSDLNKLFEGN